MEETAVLLRRARNLYDSGKYAEAEELLRSAGQDPTVLAFRAYLLYREGKNDEAAEAYRGLSRLQPEDPSHFLNLGLICFKEGRVEEARAAFERVLSLRPGDERALRSLGYCFRRLGEAGKAEDCFRKAGIGTDRVSGTKPAEKGGPPPRDLAAFDEWAREAALPPREGSGDVHRAGPGELFFHIDEKVFVSGYHLLSHRGVVVFSPPAKEIRRAAGRFGDREREILRVEGTGELGLSGRGGTLRIFHLGPEEGVGVNFPCLVLYGAAVTLSFPGKPSLPKAFLPAILDGEDRFVVALRGSPTVLRVHDDLPVCVRPEGVVAWTRDLACEEEEGALEGGWLARRRERYLRFEGQGYLVLQGLPGR